MVCRIVAPRPPYSLGQSIPTHPALCSFLYHPMRRAHSPESSASSPNESAFSIPLGALTASHARNSLRNASSSGLKLKSIWFSAWLTFWQAEHALTDDVLLDLV